MKLSWNLQFQFHLNSMPFYLTMLWSSVIIFPSYSAVPIKINTTAELETLCHIPLSQVPGTTNATNSEACITAIGTENRLSLSTSEGPEAGWETQSTLRPAKWKLEAPFGPELQHCKAGEHTHQRLYKLSFEKPFNNKNSTCITYTCRNKLLE